MYGVFPPNFSVNFFFGFSLLGEIFWVPFTPFWSLLWKYNSRKRFQSTGTSPLGIILAWKNHCLSSLHAPPIVSAIFNSCYYSWSSVTTPAQIERKSNSEFNAVENKHIRHRTCRLKILSINPRATTSFRQFLPRQP